MGFPIRQQVCRSKLKKKKKDNPSIYFLIFFIQAPTHDENTGTLSKSVIRRIRTKIAPHPRIKLNKY